MPPGQEMDQAYSTATGPAQDHTTASIHSTFI